MTADPSTSPVLVLNQYVVPDRASTGRFAFEIASAIASHGHPVTFVAGQPSYQSDLPPAPPRERRDGVEIRRLRMFGRAGRRSLAGRFLGYAAFLIRCSLLAGRLIRRERVRTLICFHNPPFLPLLGALLARSRTRFICVIWDIHPDVLLATRWLRLPPLVISAWERLNRVTYGRADTVVVISDEMRATLIAKGVEEAKVVSIPLWAEPELAPGGDRDARLELGVADGELLLLCAGNLGVTQRFEPVLEAAAQLEGAPVRFCFVGSGIHADRVRAAAHRLSNVTLLPFQEAEDYERLVAAADAGLVTLAPEVERLVVPSRALPLLSAGVPVIAVMSPGSELGRFLAEHDAGVSVETADELVAAARTWIAHPADLRESGERAGAAYRATRDRVALTDRYVELCRG